MSENQPSTAKHSLRVLHIGKYFPPYAGGMETYLRDLMVAQTKQGLQSTALVHQSALSLRSSTEQYSAGEHALSVTRAAVWLRLLFTPISPTFPRLLNRLIREKKPDLLHLHMPNVSVFWALLLPSAKSLPWVVHWHADVLVSTYSLGLRLFYRLYKPFESAVLKRSSAIIATSPPYLDTSRPLTPFKSKTHIIPLGLDPSRFNTSPAPLPDSEDSILRVLAIGRLTYYKGFNYLIRALTKTDNIAIRLVGTGDQETYLKELSANLGIADRVQFLGALSDQELEQELVNSHCLCLPSIERTEAFGMVLLEAMFFYRATVVSDVKGSGMSWVVDGQRTGLLVKTADIDELSTALKTLEQNRANLALYGRNGRHKFDERFHIEKSAEAVEDLYQVISHAKKPEA